MKRVGLYFGSFNPVHVGHLMLAQYMLNMGGLDEVRLVVSPHNPFKAAAGLAPARDRVEMARLATRDSRGIEVSDIELHLPTPSYTVRTLDALHEAEPDAEFSIIMGADNVAGLPRWREADRLKTYNIKVYPREGYDVPQLEGWKIEMVDAPRVEISSTQIREWVGQGKDVNNFVKSEVAQYIRTNNVYRDMSKSIKELEAADYASLFDLMRPVWHAVYDAIVTPEHTEHLLHKYFDVENIEAFRADGYRYFHIMKGSEEAGLVVFKDRADDLYLDKLYVLEAYRRGGLGSYALQWLCQQGRDVRLNVNRGNAVAVAAYKANGFEVEREEDIPQADGGVNNDYVMVYRQTKE